MEDGNSLWKVAEDGNSNGQMKPELSMDSLRNSCQRWKLFIKSKWTVMEDESPLWTVEENGNSLWTVVEDGNYGAQSTIIPLFQGCGDKADELHFLRSVDRKNILKNRCDKF